LLIDTHIWIWWTNGSRELTDFHIACLEEAYRDDRVHLSAMSIWEVGLAVSLGRLDLGGPIQEWAAKSLADLNLHVVSVDSAIALEANALPQPFHRDPADRIIVATSRLLHLPLFTFDRQILQYAHIETVPLDMNTETQESTNE
jgi:PIN domain nuclease of toxin-antitoxin system